MVHQTCESCTVNLRKSGCVHAVLLPWINSHQNSRQIVKETYKSWPQHTHKVTPPKWIVRHNNMVQWYYGCHSTYKQILIATLTFCSNLRILMNPVPLHIRRRMAPILCKTAHFLNTVKQMPEFLWDIPIIQVDKSKAVTISAPLKVVYQRSGLHFQHFKIIWRFFNDLLV
jgi:hypothetical protein